MTSWDALQAEGLTPPAVSPENTGRGIRIAVVDSGVNFDHPHLGLPSKGASVCREGDRIVVRPLDHRDRYGHGTSCASLIHRLAPDAEIYAVRVTSDRATTDIERLVRGLEWAIEVGAHVLSVSLGTHFDDGDALDRVILVAADAGAVVVAANSGDGALPAGCRGAMSIGLLDGVDVVLRSGAIVAEGLARPINVSSALGKPNFYGPSLSTARAAAAVARFAESNGLRGTQLLAGFKSALVVM